MTVQTVSVKLPCVTIDRAAFLADPHARRYGDVVNDKNLNFDAWLAFFNDPLRQLRLIDAELHHQRPSLAGVVVELEADPAFGPFFKACKRDDTRRHRQAIGVIVKLVMAGHRWNTTGQKGFLGGGRAGGLSEFFGKAEHYKKR